MIVSWKKAIATKKDALLLSGLSQGTRKKSTRGRKKAEMSLKTTKIHGSSNLHKGQNLLWDKKGGEAITGRVRVAFCFSKESKQCGSPRVGNKPTNQGRDQSQPGSPPTITRRKGD